MKLLQTFNNLFSLPITSAMAGFGFFWYFKIMGWNWWISMIIGLYVSALVSKLFVGVSYDEGEG